VSNIFLIIFICFPLVVVYLLKLANENINQVSIVNVTTVALYLFSILGTFVLYFQLDQYRYNTGVTDKSLVAEVLLYSCLNIICFLIGVIVTRKVIGIDITPFSSGNIRTLNSLQNFVLVGFFFFCCLVLLHYLSQIDRTAISVALTDGLNAAKQVRSNMGNAFPGKYHWYKLVMHDLGNVLTFTCFAMWLQTKNKLSLLCFLVTLLYSIFVAIMAIEKGPLAWLIIGLILVCVVVRRSSLIPRNVLIALATSIIILMIILFQMFYGADGVFQGLILFVSRAFAGSIEPAYHYLEIYPEVVDYQYGLTLPNPGGLFDFIPYRYTVEVANYVNPSLFERGIVGSMPTVFWGEAYINWGVGGVIFVSFIVGVVVALLDYILSVLNVNSFTVGVYVWMVLFIKDLSVTGFSSIFINIYLYAVITLFIFIVMLRGKIQFNIAKRRVLGL